MIICAIKKIKFVIDSQLGTVIFFLVNIIPNNNTFTIKLSGNAENPNKITILFTL